MSHTAAIFSRHRGGGSGGGSSNLPYAATMTITVDPAVVATHSTSPVVVTVFDQYTSPMADQMPTVTTTNAAIAAVVVDPDTGAVTILGVSGGIATISATLVNSQGTTIHPTVPASLTVSAQSATAVTATPSSVTISDAGTASLSATVYDQVVPPNPIAGAPVTWSRSGTKITINASTGVITGASAGAGTSTVTAASPGATSGTVAVTVTASTSVVTTVTVTPPTGNIQAGGTIDLDPVIKDQYTNLMPLEGATWGSANDLIATVDPDTGVVTGVGIGVVVITATSITDPTKHGTATITVGTPNEWDPQPGDTIFLDMTPSGAQNMQTIGQVGDDGTSAQATNLATFRARWPDQLTNSSNSQWRFLTDCDGSGTRATQHRIPGFSRITFQQTVSAVNVSTTTTALYTGSAAEQTVPVTNAAAFSVGQVVCIAGQTGAANSTIPFPEFVTLTAVSTSPHSITGVFRCPSQDNLTQTNKTRASGSTVQLAQTVLVSSSTSIQPNHRCGLTFVLASPFTSSTVTETQPLLAVSQTTVLGVFLQPHSTGDSIACCVDGGGGQVYAQFTPATTGSHPNPALRLPFALRHYFFSMRHWEGRQAGDTTGLGTVGLLANLNPFVGSQQNFDPTKSIGGGRKHTLWYQNPIAALPDRIYTSFTMPVPSYHRAAFDESYFTGKGNGQQVGATNSSINPDTNFIGKWVTYVFERKCESSFGAGDGVWRDWADYGSGFVLLNGGINVKTGIEPFEHVQLLGTWNSPPLDSTEYLNGFKLWYRTTDVTTVPARPNAPVFVSHVPGSVTLALAIPAQCDTVRIFKTTNASVPPTGGPFTQIGADIPITGGEQGTTKNVTVTVPSNATTVLSWNVGYQGSFGETSGNYTEVNPVISTPPNAPALTTPATSVTGNSASFTVTTDAAGTPASFLTPEFDTNGSGNWVAQADVPVSVAQGSPQTVTVTGLTASTVYTGRFRVRSKNASGSSSPSNTASATTSGQSLSVTGGSQTLINKGHLLLDITDGTNPVAGCTVTPTDTSKCDVYSGYTLFGKADSGSTTVTIAKGGYTSAVITITCSALDLVMTGSAGTSTTTPGAAVASWTDQSPTAKVYSEATNKPLYNATSLNSLPGLTFDGTASRLRTTDAVAALNSSSVSIFSIVKPSAAGDGRASGRQWLGNLNNASFRGVHLQFNSTNNVVLTVGSGTASAAFTSTGAYTGGSARKVVVTCQSGAQTMRIAGAQAATPPTLTYANNTSTAGSSLGCNFLGTGNFFPGDLEMILASARLWTGAEIAQLELMGTNVYGV